MDHISVGIVAPPWAIPAPAYGGVEAVIDGLGRALTAQGHSVFLWAALDSTCPVKRSGIVSAVKSSEGWHSAPLELRHVLAGYRWVLEQDVDIIHDISFVGPLIGTTYTQIPIVTTNFLPFSPPLPGHSSPDLGEIYRAMSGTVPIMALSQEHASGATATQIERVILLGTDVHRTLFGSGDGDERGPYVAFLGRMAPEKGVHTAILAARSAGVRVKIAARLEEPSEHGYFEKDVAPLLDERAEYVGELDRPAKLALLAGAVAMVNPIAWPEPFGLVMIESLACGTPVVARRGGAVAEIVQHGTTGFVCDSFDEVVEGLRKAVTLDRSACRRSAEVDFSIERMAADYLDMYRSVIARRYRLAP